MARYMMVETPSIGKSHCEETSPGPPFFAALTCDNFVKGGVDVGGPQSAALSPARS
jgi:hypothetical protein